MDDLLCELGEDVNEQGLPPGFRFHPTDEELITFYLSSKVFNPGASSTFTNNNNMVPRITEVDLNRCEPWDLPEAARTGEREWYLFSLRDRKYPTGLRTNRATGAGYWKATGKDKEVYSSANNNNIGIMIGMKKTLVFYKGRAPRGDKTRWVMHEFRLDGHLISSRQFTEEWVICRVYHKIGEKMKNPATALLRGGQSSNYLWPWGGDMMLSSSNHLNTRLMDAITTTSSANPTPLFHHPQPQPQDQNQDEEEETFLHLNKLIRTLNPVLPDPFSMPVLMNNNNNNTSNDRIQLLPAAACHNNNNRIVDRQTNNCMSHQQDLLHLHHHQAASSISTVNTTTVPKQLFMKTEETISGQLMMIHPPANDPYYQQQQLLYHGNIIDFGFSSSINEVALTKNCPHFI